LLIDADILPDFFIVLNCLNFIGDQFFFDVSKLRLVLLAIGLPIHAVLFFFLGHLHL